MKCEKCGISVLKTPLHRTNPIGQPDAGWMCIKCIEIKEPELAKNILSEDNELINALTNQKKYKK